MFKLFNKLLSYGKKHPIRMGVAAFLVYLCFSGSDNLFAKLKDMSGANNEILEPSDNDEEEQRQNQPEMDDNSMYKNSQLHTMQVSNKSAELEDLINGAHP